MKNIVYIIKKILLSDNIIVNFINNNETKKENVLTYKRFTSKHPKYKFIPFKKYGACFIELDKYDSFDHYLKKINGKNSAAYYRRKSIKNDFTFSEIDMNDFIDDIYTINTSSQNRQNRKMDSKYLKKKSHYKNSKLFKCYGIIKDKQLVAYAEIGFHGEFISFNKLLGHKNFQNFGIMYHLIINVIEETIKGNLAIKWVYYDMYFGASKGLKEFKKKFLFQTYNVTWKIQ